MSCCGLISVNFSDTHQDCITGIDTHYYRSFTRGIDWLPMDTPHKGSVMRIFVISFVVNPNNLLNNHSSCRWSDTQWHCNVDLGVCLLILSFWVFSLQVVAAGQFCETMGLNGLPDWVVLSSPMIEKTRTEPSSLLPVKPQKTASHSVLDFAALWLNEQDPRPEAAGATANGKQRRFRKPNRVEPLGAQLLLYPDHSRDVSESSDNELWPEWHY